MFKKLIYRINVRLRWLSLLLERLLRFLLHDIWFLNLSDLERWRARLVRDLRIAVLMFKTFNDQKISYQITALAYRSMLAVVPAIAIGFYLTDGIGLRNKFADVLMKNLGDLSITNVLLQAADNIVRTAESGLFGFISMASFVWIVLSLMFMVRRVFNNVWKVEREQCFFKTLGIVLGITILAPFVVIIFFTGSVVYSHVLDLLFPSWLLFSEKLKSFLSWLIFAGISVGVMFIMFKYIPGAKVHSRHALKAALVSGLVFTVLQFLYLETQVMVAKQSAVYGVLAAVPLFMVWLNLGWTIILYGAELPYAFQNVDRHSLSIEMLDEMNAEAVRARRERFQKGIKI